MTEIAGWVSPKYAVYICFAIRKCHSVYYFDIIFSVYLSIPHPNMKLLQ